MDAVNKRIQQLKEKYPDYLILLRCDDEYQSYHEDAETISKCLNIRLFEIEGHKYCAFNYKNFDTYLRMLIKAGHKVALLENILKQ